MAKNEGLNKTIGEGAIHNGSTHKKTAQNDKMMSTLVHFVHNYKKRRNFQQKTNNIETTKHDDLLWTKKTFCQ